jgi:hypothetical protein
MKHKDLSQMPRLRETSETLMRVRLGQRNPLAG